MAKAARTAAPVPELAPSPALATAVPVPSEPATPEPAALEPDAFAAAFAELAAAEASTNAESKSPKPATAQVSQNVTPPTPAAVPSPTPTEPVDEPEAEPPPAPPEPPAPPSAPLPPQPQLQQPQPPQPPPQPQPPPRYQPQPEPPMFTAEEATQLQTFYNEWPDVARAAEVMVQGMIKQAMRNMYRDMASSLAPYLQTVDTLADRSQLSELQGQVSDYDTVAGQLTTWASRQPTYLRSAYEHVIKSGTAAEVVDLINRYKQDTQPAPAQASAPAPASAPPAPAPINPALATAAARLAPVSTKRTNVVAPPADFDTAFAEFARAS